MFSILLLFVTPTSPAHKHKTNTKRIVEPKKLAQAFGLCVSQERFRPQGELDGALAATSL